MARSINSDPLLAHNFAILDVPVAGPLPFAFASQAARSAIQSGNFVGAKSVSIPEVTIEMRDIKEGNAHYVHRVPTGYVTTGETVIEWALFNTNLDMWAWVQQAIKGIIAPRRSLIVVHTRGDKVIPQRMHLLSGCVPTSWKPSSDLDALSSEVLMESLTLHVHEVILIPTPVPVTSPNESWTPTPSVPIFGG